MDSLELYLKKVIKYVQATDHEYATLFRPNLKTYPIPFFGDINNARVLTVCVNPSSTEFNQGRWSGVGVTVDELKERLESYFVPDQKRPKPHRWFLTWDQALEPLEVH